jgi:hypothetical protein
LLGTIEVMKATRRPGSGVTGTGSQACRVARTRVVTLISRKTSIRPTVAIRK